ncbi:hypothetical protein B0J11DRAFT_225406 [Dendryphion nanum]|uniref:Uncharacterized protein n=1 Tax=Dendryphion nanum TaxID=256645 RepID=A0A9P9E5M3_9PLEO|nr:hypothetical protein B0J11DRAFT_225406 [Dendryphion nanum]
MTTPSPSEFLTFYRRMAAPTTLRTATRTTTSTSSTTLRPVQTTYTRSFSLASPTFKNLSTDSSVSKDQYPDDKHATNKASSGDAHDPQSSNLKAGINSAQKSGTGGHATEGKDSSSGKEAATPEAPDPAIGMQDERGGRGGGELGKPK